MYVIDIKKCNGCAACLCSCESGAIYLENIIAKIDYSLCTSCGYCINACPQNAIIQKITEVEPFQNPVHPSLKQSMLSTLKSTAIKIGTTALPIAISKIGELISSKLETKGTQNIERNKGRRLRKQYRGGSKKR